MGSGWAGRGQTLSHAPPRFQSHPRRSRAYAPPVCELMLDSCLTRTPMPKPKGRPRWCRVPYRKPITATAKSRPCGLAGWAGSLALPDFEARSCPAGRWSPRTASAAICGQDFPSTRVRSALPGGVDDERPDGLGRNRPRWLSSCFRCPGWDRKRAAVTQGGSTGERGSRSEAHAEAPATPPRPQSVTCTYVMRAIRYSTSDPGLRSWRSSIKGEGPPSQPA